MLNNDTKRTQNLHGLEQSSGESDWKIEARIHLCYITDIVSAITTTESGCCKKVKCGVTTGWQRPARHRQERPVLRVVASRFLPEVVTLSIWGIMVRSPAPEQDRPRESVSTDRFHACINVHCRVPQ